MQCRACLKTNCENTCRLDQLKIMCFNLITDLSVHIDDNMPQQLCENCSKDLIYCFEFREKCITSNTILTSAQLSEKDITFELKEELVDWDELEQDETCHTDSDNKEKINIKHEPVDLEKNESLQCDFEYEYMYDVKPQNTTDTAPITTDVTKTVKTRKNAPRAAKQKTKTSNKKVSASPKYDCGLCTEIIEKNKLYDHVESHDKNRFCKICSLYFDDVEAMWQHRVQHLKVPNFICHICLRVVRSSFSLKCHYNIHHFGKSPKDGVICHQCNKSYTTVRNLYKHMKSIHSNKVFQCKTCSQSFATQNAVKYHRFKEHQERKIYFCKECDYRTDLPFNLSRHHLRVHAHEKFCCKLCKALFVSEHNLKRHKCQYNTNSLCPVCGLVFNVKKQLLKHMVSHSDERKYKCDRCDAAYKSRSALRIHINKHDGIRAYLCQYCPATFWRMSTLIKHRRVHTGEKPYVCKVCNKGFTGNHNLKVHMRVHGVFNLIKKKSPDDVQGCNKTSPITV